MQSDSTLKIIAIAVFEREKVMPFKNEMRQYLIEQAALEGMGKEIQTLYTNYPIENAKREKGLSDINSLVISRMSDIRILEEYPNAARNCFNIIKAMNSILRENVHFTEHLYANFPLLFMSADLTNGDRISVNLSNDIYSIPHPSMPTVPYQGMAAFMQHIGCKEGILTKILMSALYGFPYAISDNGLEMFSSFV